jgi:hypothetical protein
MPTSSITEHIAASFNRFQVPTACFRTTLIPSLFLSHHSTHYFVSVFTLISSALWIYFITQEAAVCCDPHNLSNPDSRTTKQFAYKRTFCTKCCVHKKLASPYIFVKTWHASSSSSSSSSRAPGS